MSLVLRDEILRPAAGLYELAFWSATAPMALASRSGGGLSVDRANQAFLRLFELPQSGVEGRPLSQVFRGASADQVRRAVEQCLRDGEAVEFRAAHGSRAEFALLRIAVQRVVLNGAASVLISATEARPPLALSTLGEAGVLAEIGALSRGMVFIFDYPCGTLRCAADPLLDRLGLTPGVMSAADALSLVDAADHDVVARHMAAQLEAADGEVVQTVCRMRGGGGEQLWVNVRSQVFARTPDGGVQRILGVTTDETEHYEHQAELAAAANALAHAELNERRRIGRELHDSTAQLLVAARLGLSRLSGQGALSGEPLRVLDDAREAIESAQREIRNFSFVLHPPALLEAGGLEDTLRVFALGFGRRTGLEISVEAGRRSMDLPFRTKVALFRVTQEALMNVYRHAGAASAVVRLKRKRGRVVLEVEDDGVGLPDGEAPPEGVGISGMRARMKQLGGAFELAAGATGVLVRASIEEGDDRPRRNPVKRPAAPVAGRLVSGEDPTSRQGLA